jgi:hypothetical protein
VGDKWDTIGVPVPLIQLLACTDEVAALVDGFVAYPSGFYFSLVLVSRSPDSERLLCPDGWLSPGGQINEGVDFRLGLRTGGGPTIWARGLGESEGKPAVGGPVVLHASGGGGSNRHGSYGYNVSPLPSSGNLAFVCEWRRFGISETATEIDANIILAAARQAVPIWPDDVDPQDGTTE